MLKEQQIRDAAMEFQTIMKLKPPLNEKATLSTLVPLVKKCLQWIEPLDVFSSSTMQVINELESLKEGEMPEIEMSSPLPPSEEELMEKIRTSLKLRELKDVAISNEAFSPLFDKLDEYGNVEILRDDMFELLAKQKIAEPATEEVPEDTQDEETEEEEAPTTVPFLAIDPKFKEACPPLTIAEFEALEDLILRDGVILNPILTWGGVIVDGHNRYAIAQKHNIPFATKEMPFETEDEVLIWIKENAVSQRNLPEFVRFEMIKDIEVLLKNIGRERKKFRGLSPSAEEEFSTRKELAAKANMSPAQVQRAKVVDALAPAEMKEQLREGKIKIGAAHAALTQKDTTLSTEMRVKKATREFGKWSVKYASFLTTEIPAPEMAELINALETFLEELKRVNNVVE